MTSVAVIDHGAGNLVSMMRAIETVGANPTLVQSGPLDAFDGVVLPGVGATGPAMRSLSKTGLADELRSFRGPLLGVCVGMQLLFDYSTEDGTHCLGLIKGQVRRIDATPLPHVGWNSVEHEANALFDGLDGHPLFYFVHSFAVDPAVPNVTFGRNSYDNDTFTSVALAGAVSGVQFHPEKSGGAGLAVLGNFLGTSGSIRHVA